MKRYLKKNRFQLSDHEKENLWLGVRAKAGGEEKASQGRTSFRPVLGLTTVVVTVLVLVVWLGNEDPVRKVGPSISYSPMVAEEPVESLPEPSSIIGRVVEKETGQPLAYANITIEGSGGGSVTDSDGRFRMEALEPGREKVLNVALLGYEKEKIQTDLKPGEKLEIKFEMEPMIVATLEAFAVEGAEYMVEVKSAINEQYTSSETFEKFAIDSREDALSKTAGVVSRAGELYVRGGRGSETKYGSGGAKLPNGESYDLMYFDHAGVNPFMATEDDSLSTFAVDIDNASYTVARRYIQGGSLPPKNAIRVEEFVNFFDAGYAIESEETFAINLDGAPSRFGKGYHLVRVGLQGKTIADEDRKSANLVFLIDVSGSMDRENRLGLVKKSLGILLDELDEGDQVGIVVYGSRAEVKLQPTDISRRQEIQAAIDGLGPNGSTNAYEGLQMAYSMARQNYQANKLNRLILCSDGVANMGTSTKAVEMLEQIRKASDKGITLSTIGFGMGNYNDVLMEQLADKGDGNYYYVDKPDEAERVFRENLTGLLQTIARQVKVQVEFDEDSVDRWRLLGYENRDVADRDFRNDNIDAGEVGAGHQVTALYELKLTNLEENHHLGTVRLRYETPLHDPEKSGEVAEISQELTLDLLSNEFSVASAHCRLQMVVAEFAEILRGSIWAKESRFSDLVPLADGLAEELDDERVQELAELIRQAADLQPE